MGQGHAWAAHGARCVCSALACTTGSLPSATPPPCPAGLTSAGALCVFDGAHHAYALCHRPRCPAGLASAGARAGPALHSLPPAARDYLIALNNSDVAAEYVTKLKVRCACTDLVHACELWQSSRRACCAALARGKHQSSFIAKLWHGPMHVST